ncbi:MAG: prepilin-type N-terminal cleavage/methylation domain-containing protein [Deltaproteobacteria bacterium]|jgi:type II secretion system protein I
MIGFKARSSCGFTLLEVMISVAVIAIAFVAVLGAQSRGISLSDESRFNTTAALLAQGKMAEISASGPDAIGARSGDFGKTFPAYAWALSTEPVSFEGAGKATERLRRVDLVVTYKDRSQYQYHIRWYVFSEGA